MFNKILEEHGNLESVLSEVAKSKGIPDKKINELLSEVPIDIRKSPAFFDKLSKQYRYFYGKPYITSNHVVAGTDQFISVEQLLYVSIAINNHLLPPKRESYYRNLVQKDKHKEFLSEALLLSFLRDKPNVDYEVLTGVGNKTADWFIEHAKIKILIDMKYRVKELINKMMVQGRPVPDSLFKNVEDKFIENSNFIQGVWVVTSVKFSKKELKNEVKKLNTKKVNFAIISSQKSVYCITNSCKTSKKLKIIFQFPKDKSVVY